MRERASDFAALTLRVVAGAIFIPHGYSKVFSAGGAGAFAADMPAYGIPAFLGYLAAYSELLGGALIIVGLLTRLDAFCLAATMFVATFVVQLPDALHEAQGGSVRYLSVIRGIETPFSLFGATVALILLGGGRLSLDHLFSLEGRFTRLLRIRKAADNAAALPVTRE